MTKIRKVLYSMACMVGVISGCTEPTENNPAAPFPAVSVYKVDLREIGNYREFVARTEAFQEVAIRARVEGELIERHFDEGTKVEKGQLLFTIDPQEFSSSVAEIEADLKSKVVGLDAAERDLKRGKEIAQDGFISQADLDQLTTNFDQARAAVKSAEASLEKAKLNLSYTQIYAPFDGQIGKVNYDIGNIVGLSSGPLATLTDFDPIFVTFQVEEADYISYRQAHQGIDNFSMDISIRLPNNTAFDSKGVLNFADTKIDQSTGTVELRASFANPNDVVVPGLFVTLMLESQKKELQALIPQAAVQENQQGKFVLVLDSDDKVLQRAVKLGRRIEAMWVVEGGLEEGERIIFEGQQKVKAGAKVKPVMKTVNPVTGMTSVVAQ
ncbi:efflux RND transporter periplasmic adaptor subunit [Pseudoalteromonas haloplanktis]|uniref:Efflux RND transporter periplasmic adaptor subunit n=1 Tax=Pseudoalteromonas haloplanktis TaxID=228 RepID=A0ABU1BF42_PSEHA|nr:MULTISPECIES: efflux RND transporter periplasmic adaptor subunit [Pseudoalteromonas]MDQ9093040.1 efflux RND transporter periplasmic adaptor subunit [Pseudoalteromonas haloplanktis]BDF95177.1 hemolysin secretion protein D [Pseudoalteromonas sp. KAN5]